MDKEDMVIYTMQYYSVIKKRMKFCFCNNMDEPGRYYVMFSEISNANTVCYHLYLKSKK